MFHESKRKRKTAAKIRRKKYRQLIAVHMKVSRHKNVALNVFVLNYSKDSDWAVYAVLVMKSI